MTIALSNLTDNPAKGLHRDCKSNLEYITNNDGFLTYKCLDCSKTYEKQFDKDLLKRF